MNHWVTQVGPKWHNLFEVETSHTHWRNPHNDCQLPNMQHKTNFHKPFNLHLVKATQPFDCLSIDFKGPLPSLSRNRYLLTIIDEFSRFTFAYPCSNMEAETVHSCLYQIFSFFGIPTCIGSNRDLHFFHKKQKHSYIITEMSQVELLSIIQNAMAK